jgi:5-methyltetrahydropteroyltriglutamate--homocysteine methyltransferase
MVSQYRVDHVGSPQCGFASVAAGNLLSDADQWRKLELLVDTAGKVWGAAEN